MTNPLFSVRRSLALILVAGAIGVAMFLTLAAAEAAPGGQGKGQGTPGGPGGGPGSEEVAATLFVTPDPAPAGSTVQITGCGYSTDGPVEVHVVHATYTEIWATGVWGSGCVSFPLTTAEAGTYDLEAYQQVKKKTVLVGTGTFEVQ